MKVRKCKCCRIPNITKKCFIKPFRKTENHCNAWRLWYDKKSDIICTDCEAEIPDFINRIKSVDFKGLQKSISGKPNRNSRPLRSQLWYLIDLGIINVEMFQSSK